MNPSLLVTDPISVNDIRYIIKLLKEKNIGILITDHNGEKLLVFANVRILLVKEM